MNKSQEQLDIERRWIADQLNLPYSVYETAVTFPVYDKDGNIMACFALTDFKEATYGNSVQISIAARPDCHKKWCRKSVLLDLAKYVGIDLKCTRLWTQLPKNNKAARRLNEAFGMKFERCSRRGWDGKHDALVYSMIPEEAKFLKYYIERVQKRDSNESS